jgi:two-component system, cell cycle sensor histidine kinase and response regulator CckA
LGLSTVYGIVKQNKGFITVDTEEARGTTITVYLPRYAKKKLKEKQRHEDKSEIKEIRCILLVEDEEIMLKTTQKMLERLGYRVICASSPGEAIHIADKHSGEIDILISDVVMPEMNGRDLAKNLLSFYPDLKRLFMSGYTADVIAHQGVLDEGVHFIQKPFSMQELAGKVAEVIKNQ